MFLHVVSQAVGCWPLTVEACVHSQASSSFMADKVVLGHFFCQVQAYPAECLLSYILLVEHLLVFNIETS